MTKRILVIDDEDGLREVIQYCLEAVANWQVLTAVSGYAGLSIAELEQPDAILLDVVMPEMDGTEMAQRLHSNPATQTIPIILLTAKVKLKDQETLRSVGVMGMIVKPFKPLELINQIREILGWSNEMNA
ncbi:MAG: response regulator [Cyanobacteria bacterium CRU_2_1]|nr:response regulator [Cyanobacteria bacterium CRU_2_1]